jgi:hypothetical protein
MKAKTAPEVESFFHLVQIMFAGPAPMQNLHLLRPRLVSSLELVHEMHELRRLPRAACSDLGDPFQRRS